MSTEVQPDKIRNRSTSNVHFMGIRYSDIGGSTKSSSRKAAETSSPLIENTGSYFPETERGLDANYVANSQSNLR